MPRDPLKFKFLQLIWYVWFSIFCGPSPTINLDPKDLYTSSRLQIKQYFSTYKSRKWLTKKKKQEVRIPFPIGIKHWTSQRRHIIGHILIFSFHKDPENNQRLPQTLFISIFYYKNKNLITIKMLECFWPNAKEPNPIMH